MPINFNEILLVEDNKTLGYALSEYLKLYGFNVCWVKDGNQAITSFLTNNYHLVILDVMLPKIDGFEVAKNFKKDKPKVPVIFLTAKSMKIDKIRGFKIGADDYMVKPIEEEELIYRINAVLKRVYQIDETELKGIFEVNGFTLNAWTNTIEFNGAEMALTNKECTLLKKMCENPDKVVSTKSLLMKVWGNTDVPAKKTLDVHLVKLRKKLKLLTKDKVQILNIHSKGYFLQIR